MNESPTILEILVHGNMYRMTITPPSDNPFINPTQRIDNIPYDPRAINLFKRKISDAILEKSRPSAANDPETVLVRAGKVLFDELFPEHNYAISRLVEQIKGLNSPLLISTDETTVLWELLYFNELFLSQRIPVGRRLLTCNVPSVAPERRGSWRCLMIADPNANEEGWALPDARTEAEHLRKWMTQRGINCDDFLTGSTAEYDTLLDKFSEHDYDIIHYAGHVVYLEDKNEYALRLRDGEAFSCSTIRAHVKGSPLVFLNGCWSANSRKTTRENDSVASLTEAFLSIGARAVIGTLFEVPDRGARAFAEIFYDALLSSRTIGEAILEARRKVRENPAHGASWASFVLYGNPCLKFDIRDSGLFRTLEKLEIHWSKFETSCLSMLELAFRYGKSNNMVSSFHLFSALMASESGEFRKSIVKDDVSVDKLKANFQKIFQEKEEPEDSSYLRASRSVEDILVSSVQISADQGHEKISELDVAEAFWCNKTNQTGKMLRELNLDPEELRPYKSKPGRIAAKKSGTQNSGSGISNAEALGNLEADPRLGAGRIGPLPVEKLERGVYRLLLYAYYLALKNNSDSIPSVFLLFSLMRDEESPFSHELAKFGRSYAHLRSQLTTVFQDKERLEALPATIPCSKSVGQILLLAQKISESAGKPLVDQESMCKAFVRHGGGSASKWLSGLGIFLPALQSRFFHADGAINFSFFDPMSKGAIQQAFIRAGASGHTVVGRTHLLVSLLEESGSPLAVYIRQKGGDCQKIADTIFRDWPVKSKVEMPEELAHLSSGLVKIFCELDVKIARTTGQSVVNLDNLVVALIEDGIGEAGAVLKQFGIELDSLKQRLLSGPASENGEDSYLD